jgi:hypothetical protein
MNRITSHVIFAALAMLASLALLPAAAFFAGSPPDPDVITVQEYVNDLTGHYFLVSDALEKRAVDSGAEGAGWHPTGFQFGAYGATSGRADLPNRIGPYFPPYFITTNPNWSNSFIDITGLYFDLCTAQDPQDRAAVAAHSFAQMPTFGTGLHVSSLDRVSGAIVSMDSVYQFATRAPIAGAADSRVAPWPAGLDHFIELSFALNAKTVKRANPQSHAWGGPMIEFRDVRSGKAIDVTLQTFGTIPPADFVGVMEPATGNVFVSTVFRADPSFGSRVKGDFVPCAGNGPCASGTFEFRIRREDFAQVVAMARASNPALSADPADYILVNFRFRGGVFNDAELGMTLDTLKLDIF